MAITRDEAIQEYGMDIITTLDLATIYDDSTSVRDFMRRIKCWKGVRPSITQMLGYGGISFSQDNAMFDGFVNQYGHKRLEDIDKNAMNSDFRDLIHAHAVDCVVGLHKKSRLLNAFKRMTDAELKEYYASDERIKNYVDSIDLVVKPLADIVNAPKSSLKIDDKIYRVVGMDRVAHTGLSVREYTITDKDLVDQTDYDNDKHLSGGKYNLYFEAVDNADRNTIKFCHDDELGFPSHAIVPLEQVYLFLSEKDACDFVKQQYAAIDKHQRRWQRQQLNLGPI